MTRLLNWLGLALLVSLAATSCSETRTKSFDGQLCSTDSSDSLQYVCDRTFSDLICIATYKVGPTDAYVCRVACQDHSDCPAAGDVCCAGKAVANSFGATRGCTPRERCTSDPIAVLPPDGGMSSQDGAVPTNDSAPNPEGDAAPSNDAPMADTGVNSDAETTDAETL